MKIEDLIFSIICLLVGIIFFIIAVYDSYIFYQTGDVIRLMGLLFLVLSVACFWIAYDVFKTRNGVKTK